MAAPGRGRQRRPLLVALLVAGMLAAPALVLALKQPSLPSRPSRRSGGGSRSSGSSSSRPRRLLLGLEPANYAGAEGASRYLYRLLGGTWTRFRSDAGGYYSDLPGDLVCAQTGSATGSVGATACSSGAPGRMRVPAPGESAAPRGPPGGETFEDPRMYNLDAKPAGLLADSGFGEGGGRRRRRALLAFRGQQRLWR